MKRFCLVVAVAVGLISLGLEWRRSSALEANCYNSAATYIARTRAYEGWHKTDYEEFEPHGERMVVAFTLIDAVIRDSTEDGGNTAEEVTKFIESRVEHLLPVENGLAMTTSRQEYLGLVDAALTMMIKDCGSAYGD